MTARFPFSAIVGQADMKDALLCNAVDPNIGGVLISGTRGTAKSTAARSLAHLLPTIRVVADCPYNCPPDEPSAQCERCGGREIADSADVEEIRTPFVTLPIGATEDRVLGTIDLESAIQDGERAFEPGLLASANRGILYIDEVNLLPDHLVDVMLDAAASGTSRVEREGISVEHPADVLLVGTMNPEEGQLRPQLLDRFGLSVEIDDDFSPEERKSVVKRRARFEADPESMLAEWRDEETDLATTISRARHRLDDVRVPEELLDQIVEICLEHDVDGLRADIVIHRTARALAALAGETAVGAEHVRRAAELALGHRSETAGDSGGGDPPDPDGSASDGSSGDSDKPAPEDRPDLDISDGSHADDGEGQDPKLEQMETEDDDEADGATAEHVFPVSPGPEPPSIEAEGHADRGRIGDGSGRSGAQGAGRRGHYYRAEVPGNRATDVALDATIRAAAPHQPARSEPGSDGPAVKLQPADVRVKRRRPPVRHLVVFVVDSSGSMGARDRMAEVKGAMLSLLEDAYHHRDAVSLVGFREDRAATIVPPTSSAERVADRIAALPTGGRTPLAAGLKQAGALVDGERRAGSPVLPVLAVVTDGRSNYAESGVSPVEAAIEEVDRLAEADIPVVFFDTETGPVRLGLVKELADRIDAEYHRFEEFDETAISQTVRDVFSVQSSLAE